ncbi:MAG: hypothetical protein FWC71_06045 [Defluviitaleaceae bacterium]|nr:hypothetical protein [Defluviitaleaceae bacterium]
MLRIVAYGTGTGLPLPAPPDFNAPDANDEPPAEPETTPVATTPAPITTTPYPTADIPYEPTPPNRRLIILFIAIPVALAILATSIWRYRAKNKLK